MSAEITAWACPPVISVVVPVVGADRRMLQLTVDSLRAQLYPHWELWLSADAGQLTQAELRELARPEPRIRLLIRANNSSLSAQANGALSLSSADFVAFIEAGDSLSRDALYWITKEIKAQPNADLIFSDEDKIASDGTRSDPWFKPDWNPALMLSQDAFGQLGVYRRALVQNIGGLREQFDENQRYDLVLRCSGQTTPERIRHVPRILYHRTEHEPSERAEGRLHEREAGRRAIEDHLVTLNISGKVKNRNGTGYQVEYELPAQRPRVSVIIATTAQPQLLEPCLRALAQTTYEDIEVLLLVNEVHLALPERAALLSRVGMDNIRVLSYARSFNYSWVNNWGAEQASGQLLCFLNDDTELITSEWLEYLVARVSLDRVGAAGPMLYYPDQTIQHAGVILGLGGVAGHACVHEPRGAYGYFGRAYLEQDVSCVTAACMVVRRDVFHRLEGFDEELPVAYNDVDLCIRIREAGWRILWTPTVELVHHESASLGRHDSKERAYQHLTDVKTLRQRWASILDSDPFYNRNLSLERQYEFAFPPRR